MICLKQRFAADQKLQMKEHKLREKLLKAWNLELFNSRFWGI
jgi:hypothetical protein